jgi:transcriptional antiterminator NusG
MTTDSANDQPGEEAQKPDEAHVEGVEAAPTPAPEPTEAEAPPEQPPEAPPAAAEPPAEPPKDDSKKWYVVKVQSGREESIREAIERRVKIEGLQDAFGQIIIPVERVTEMSRGKRVVKERKLYPGYLMVNLEFNDRMLYLFRETSGVGDFVGGSYNKPPPPMTDKEVERLKKTQLAREAGEAPPKEQEAPFEKGDHVKVKDGTFAGMEGMVKDLLEHKGAVVVELTIFGRPVPVELEYWQVDEA